MNYYGAKDLAESWRTVRKNTIQIAEDIPESKYGYRPTPDSRSVAETLVHIAMLGRSAHFLHEEDRRPSLEDLAGHRQRIQQDAPTYAFGVAFTAATRSCALVAAWLKTFYSAFVPQYDKVSTLTTVPTYDPGTGNVSAWLL